MGLALQTDYALRTLIFLVVRPGRTTVAEIAEFFGISVHHVAKAVHQLSKTEYIRSLRGVGGGIELAKPPEEINIGELIERFEGNRIHLLECVALDGVCAIQPACRLRGVLAEAERRQMDYLKSIRLSDLVQPGEQLVQLANDSDTPAVE